MGQRLFQGHANPCHWIEVSKCRHCHHWVAPFFEGDDGRCFAEVMVSLKDAPVCVEVTRHSVGADEGENCPAYQPKQILRVAWSAE